MDAYLIKNTLATGVIRLIHNAEATVNGMLRVPPRGSGGLHSHFAKPVWAPTEADARKRVEVLRLRKIKSLRAQIEKLENLQIVIKE